jgi:hypothetical protein
MLRQMAEARRGVGRDAVTFMVIAAAIGFYLGR